MKRRLFHVGRTKLMFAVLFAAVCFAPPVKEIASFPSIFEMSVNQRSNLPIFLTADAKAESSNADIVHVWPMLHHHRRELAVFSEKVGEATVSTKLFGFLPWKSVRVKVVPSQFVYVGGQSVGIRLFTKGAMVVGYDRHSTSTSPGAMARVQVGDMIEQIDGHHIRNAEELKTWTNRSTANVHLTVKRGNAYKTIQVAPETDTRGNRHLGLYVRDRTAGVGTLTFYDPVHHTFGALGHVITDADTGQRMIGTGQLFGAQITGIVKGSPGQPGEKTGNFQAREGTIGRIDENTDYGVFGSMTKRPLHDYIHEPIAVALPSQIHTGAARMLTVVGGQQIDSYTIEIEDITRQDTPSTKSMIVKVTDKRLLSKAGGIVQGMSGSPIIQDGKLVGAVTHVFVSDPTRGYGVYAKWMLAQASEKKGIDTDVSISNHSLAVVAKHE